MIKSRLGLIVFSAFCGAFFILCAYFGAAIITFDNARIAEAYSVREQSRPGYTIKTSGGEVCVFDNSDGSELAETGISLQNLREEDRKLLENGIEAKNREEVLKLLEDFQS